MVWPFTRRKEKALSQAPSRGWWPLIREPFTGAWQRNQEERADTLLSYPTLYACISRIATDIGKLPFRLKARDSNGIWNPVDRLPYSALLDRPNHYQTPQQFRESWMLSKLMQGNTYALKQRDGRDAVTGLYILDPVRVMPLVSDSGDVLYRLYTDNLNLLAETNGELVVPSSEIIHDRCICPFHPLVGVPPIAAAHWPTLKNMRILRSSAEFFGNGAQPSGILSAPGAIGDDTAKRLSAYWNENFTGKNAGKVAVVGDGLQFVSLAAKSVDSQMVEQLRYSDEQICQPFGIPPFKVGLGTIPSGLGVDAINQLYYEDALQSHIQSMESLLTIGLSVQPLKVDIDETVLMRMDAGKKADYHRTLMDAGIETNNEARKEFALPPLEGGDTVYMQQQDFPLDQVRHNQIISNSGAVADPEDGMEQAGGGAENIQQEALNGAQVTALQGIIFEVQAGNLNPDSARQLIAVAFPLISEEEIDAILGPIIDEISNGSNDSDPDAENEIESQARMLALLVEKEVRGAQHA